MTALSVEAFDQLIQEAQWLWRWEAQPEYHEPEEAEPFDHWRAGTPDDLDWLADWLQHIRDATQRGWKYQRVRQLAEPPTEYQRWGLSIVPSNIDAGEEVRLIEESAARTLGLPEYDFVIVNGITVARMNFGPNGFTGADLIEGDDAVARHRDWRATAWEHAQEVSTYVQRSP